MASITERKRQSGESKWQAVIRAKGHSPVVHTFDTRAQAEAFAAQIEAAQRKIDNQKGRALQKLRRLQPTNVPFYERKLEEILKDFAYGMVDPTTGKRPSEPIEPKRNMSTRAKPTSKRRPTPQAFKAVGPLWGHFPSVLDNVGDVVLADARSSWVLSYIDKMSRKMSARGRPYTMQTIGKHLSLMKAACEEAALKADIEDPRLYFTIKKSKKKKEKGRERRLEHGEHERIMACLRATGRDQDVAKKRQWRCLYRLALETGARLQELVLAEWSEFSYAGVWSIPADHTKKSTARHVSLSPRARRIVQMLRAMSLKNSKFVFNAFGTVASVSKGWAYRIKQAGIVGLTFHDLRHEATTRMVTHPNQLRLDFIQKMVGHESSHMTDRYTHMRPADFVGLFDRRPN